MLRVANFNPSMFRPLLTFSYDLSEKMYGQKYDSQLFEPRRWIERPEGVGNIDEGHPTFGFSRR